MAATTKRRAWLVIARCDSSQVVIRQESAFNVDDAVALACKNLLEMGYERAIIMHASPGMIGANEYNPNPESKHAIN